MQETQTIYGAEVTLFRENGRIVAVSIRDRFGKEIEIVLP